MGKTCKGKAKAAAKVAKAKAKINRKAKALALLLGLGVALIGCATSDSAQPAKSQTQNNSFDDCVFVFAANATVSNGVIIAEGGNLPAMEMLTQTQSLESSGTESFAQTATQTPTTDIKPDVDVHYNDAIGAGGSTAKSFVDSLTTGGLALLSDYITNRKSGKITVEKKDGTTETLECEGGKCTTANGTVLDESTCKECFTKQ
jgi:sugar lactone lactonase YvrE